MAHLISATRWNIFLQTLAETARVDKSLEASGIERTVAYDRRESNLDFAKRWEEALIRGYEMLEDVATKRAVEGVSDPVFYEGNVCGHVQKYSDGLLQFLLKGNIPKKYRERFEATLNGNITLEQIIAEAANYKITEGQGPSHVNDHPVNRIADLIPEMRKRGRPKKPKPLNE